AANAALVTERDANLATYTAALTEKDAAYTALVNERDTNLEIYTVALAEKDGAIAILNESITEKDSAYAEVVAERDARFVDTDADGITDVKEVELETDPNVGTVFYLDNTEFEIAVANARETGQRDVILNPLGYGLVSNANYQAIVAERDARFLDTDSDGLTDVREIELETDIAAETRFYLQGAFDNAIATSNLEGRQAGRSDVTGNPSNFNLTTTDAYNAIVLERDARPTLDAFNAIIEERNARFVDTDKDGLTDVKEIELETDSAVETTFYLKRTYDEAVATSSLEGRQAGRSDVIGNPDDFNLTTVEAFNAVIAERNARPTQAAYNALEAERDARFVDTDEDGLTDVKEIELETDSTVETAFYLQVAYDDAVAASNSQGRQTGRTDVTGNPANFDLTTIEAYNTVIAERNARPTQAAYNALEAERDARFLDTDEDGLTDVKESELETDAAIETTFYLKSAYDDAVVASSSQGRQAGRVDVTGNPESFNLTTIEAFNAVITERDARPTQAAYNALKAERDARFVDADEDGLTDVKEIELETDLTVETAFYLQAAYDNAVVASNSQGRQTGRTDVTESPANFNLTTIEAYNTVIAERDARPTQVAYDARVAERDARFVDTDEDGLTDVKESELETDAAIETTFYLKSAYDDAVVASSSQGRQAGRVDVTGNPENFNLTTIEAFNAVIAERDARPTQAAYSALESERDTRFVDTDEDGLTDLKEIELEADPTVETAFYLQGVYNDAVAASNSQGRQAGRSEVTTNPSNFNLRTDAAYAAVVAERDARFVDTDQDGLTDLKEEELESDTAEDTTFYLKSAYDSAVTSSREAGRAEVTTNPQNFSLITRDAYNLVVAERDARVLDSDQDGLTDEKEIELGVSISDKTNFYLQGAFDEIAGDALDEALEQVTANPQNYGFASRAAYNAVIAERDARFVDTDRDGLTDQKENELATDSTGATTFYLKSAYDSVIAESLQIGRNEVVENPQNFALTSNAAYNNVVSQRDARFVDSDEDGLTDVIEAELETDPNRSTLFSILESPSNFKIAFSPTTGDEDNNFLIAEATTEDDELFADSDLDGITDAKEQELNTNPDEQTTFYVKTSYDSAVAASRVAGRNDVTINPQNYDLTTTTAYQAVIAERDARFIDSDRDGLTDTKEVELATNASEETTFYLQSFFDNAVANSRQSGRSEVTSNPQNYDLTTTSSYDEVVAQRDARFVDSDQDGLTDIKEGELSSDSAAETIFYLQGAYDTAVAEALQSGSDTVTNNPGNYNLTSTSAYDAVVAQRDSRPTLDAFNAIAAERDARFVDTDQDGLTDVKETELETDSTVETVFYLQGAYNSAIAASSSQGRQAGRTDVTGTPGNFNLTTVAAYNAVLAERDARPTQVAYDARVAERDARFVDTDEDGLTDVKEIELETDAAVETTFYLQRAYDNAVTASNLQGRQLGRGDVTGNPGTYNLTTVEAYNAVIAERDARPTQVAYDARVAERDARFVDTDEDGLTDVKENELETDAAVATTFYLQGAYDSAVVASNSQGRQAGRSDVTGSPGNFNLTTVAAYNAVIAERDARPTQVAYDARVAERDARFVDTDEDGLTDVKEIELETDAAVETTFYLQRAYDNAVTASNLQGRQLGRGDVTGNPGTYNLTTVEAYNAVIAERDARPTQFAYDARVAERDARFVDTDEDGLTDVKENELETDAAVATTFYLQGAYDSAVVASNSQGRQAGRSDVTGSPGNFNLTTIEAYNMVIAERDARPTQVAYDARVAERDARFVDTDEDGLTDVKENELETDVAIETTFYLQGAYDNAVATANSQGRQTGRFDVTGSPGTFALTTVESYNTVIAERDARPTQAAYDARVAERDARFVDTDEDGLTDVKEGELETDVAVATSFYLQGTYDSAVATANSQGRLTGRTDVTGSPANFNLTTIEAYNTVIAERDARPTQVAYDALAAERDARFVDTDQDGLTDVKEIELETDVAVETGFYLQGAYDAAVSASNLQGRQTGRLEVAANPAGFNLTSLDAYNTVVAERDARFVDTDGDGLTDSKEIELETDATFETRFYLQGAYDSAVSASNLQGRQTGRLEVGANPASFNLTTLAAYNTVVAERDARFLDTDEDGLTDVKEAELESDNNELTPFYLQDAYELGIESARFEGRTDVTNNPNAFSLVSNAQYNFVVAQRDARPTRDAYDTVLEERDARPTLGEVKDARLGSVVLQPDNGNNSVKIRFSIEETDDLKVWTRRDEINEVTVPLELGSKFYRFALQDE
ncbi:hypothetical protein N9Z55_08435, partial [Akkermansiaceae bacterium]|nr:hypothetical protein [Akkermansiaceae bacterium]